MEIRIQSSVLLGLTLTKPNRNIQTNSPIIREKVPPTMDTKDTKDTKHIRLLIIEDNLDIAGNISDFLEPQGYILDFAIDGAHGLQLAVSNTYDVIILDLMLPGMDGITLCQKFRDTATSHTPVLMLTARDTLEDKILGFDSGADDYLVKPFALRELAARINVLAKRGKITSPSTLTVSDLVLDMGTVSVHRAGHPIKLSKICFNILKTLMQASPNVVSRDEIEKVLWGDMPPDSDALRSHIYTLRQKVDKPFFVNLIHTVQGIGFQIKKES